LAPRPSLYCQCNAVKKRPERATMEMSRMIAPFSPLGKLASQLSPLKVEERASPSAVVAPSNHESLAVKPLATKISAS